MESMELKTRLAGPTIFFFRYGLAAIFIVTGFILLFVAPPSARYEGFSLCIGSGLSVLLLNVLHRMGTEGDSDRSDEQAARDFYGRHGHWPDEPPPRR